MTDPQERTGAVAAGLLALLGATLGGVLWVAWRPTTFDCNTISECFGPPVTAAGVTLLCAAATLIALRLLHLRPVFLTTVFGFVGASALVLSLQTLLSVRGHDGLAPWWCWVLLGAVLAPLAHWVLQPDRGWVARVLPVLLVIGLVVGGQQWASATRAQDRLESLATVGVERVLVPDLDGYRLRTSWASSDRDSGTDYISLSFNPEEGSRGYPKGYLLPVADRDLCQLARDIVVSSRDGDCRETGDGVVLEGEFVVGSGVVHDDTLLLLEGDPKDITLEQLQQAVGQARPGTLEELRDGEGP